MAGPLIKTLILLIKFSKPGKTAIKFISALSKKRKNTKTDAKDKLQLKQHLTEATYIAFDLETTGGNPNINRITEISGVKYKNSKVIATFQQLVNPHKFISKIITKITGITNQMVKDSPSIKEVLPKFLNLLKTLFLLAIMLFQIGFFWSTILVKFVKKINNLYFCTHLLGKSLPSLPKKSLGGFAEFLEISHKTLHRAQEDAECTLQLF